MNDNFRHMYEVTRVLLIMLSIAFAVAIFKVLYGLW